MNEAELVIQGNAAAVRRMDQISPMLAAWFKADLLEIHRALPHAHGGLLLGAPVWGLPYIERMMRYSICSLLTEANLEALSGKAMMVLYTLPDETARVWELVRPLRQAGIHTPMAEIPAPIWDAMQQTKDDKYGIVSTVGSLLAHRAGHAEMGLHMYMPDHVYGSSYFLNLAKLGGKHAGIIQQSVSDDA
jgi:hypothetical protein